MRTRCLSVLIVACGLSAGFGLSSARADVKLPAIFGDHMVLQRDQAVPVWGWASPGEQITVKIGTQSQATTADKDGKWQVKLDKLTLGEPTTLTITGKNTLTINDVLVGDVWLGSGQSNMAMTVNRCADAEAEQANAKYPKIRLFIESSTGSKNAQKEGKGKWELCSPETVGKFSGSLYFFGRELHKSLNVPMGLVVSSVGGTPIESWICPASQRKTPGLKSFIEAYDQVDKSFNVEEAKKKYAEALIAWEKAVAKAKAESKEPPRKPVDPVATRERNSGLGGLFNGKIEPLIPFALKGAIWYQGEANTAVGKAPHYEEQLKLLVTNWRECWGQGDFPFAWVQLPNYSGGQNNWPLVREAMLKNLALPNTGMAITIDIGEVNDIHPKNKQDVGKRLSAWALGSVYGQKVATSGPIYTGSDFKAGEAIVQFKHIDAGLVAKGGKLEGFTLAGEDKVFHPATAQVVGSTVVVTSDKVKAASAVRYAWENNPKATLFNKAGLPASPFRSDKWEK